MTAPMADIVSMIGTTLAAICCCPRARWYGWALRSNQSSRPNKPAMRGLFCVFLKSETCPTPSPALSHKRTAQRGPLPLPRRWTQSRPKPRTVRRAAWTAPPGMRDIAYHPRPVDRSNCESIRASRSHARAPRRSHRRPMPAHRAAWSRVPPTIKVSRAPRSTPHAKSNAVVR